MSSCRRFWADDGQLFPNPVKEGLPTILPEPICGTICMACPFRAEMPFLQCAKLIVY